MIEITLHLDKSIEENAGIYYDKAKKAKRKLDGVADIIEKSKKHIVELESVAQKEQKVVDEKEKEKELRQREKKWYEKFRWFISSEGFLCVGGRDATTNEILIKKHVEKDDLIFHTEMPGSPFFVIKTEGKTPKETINEVAIAVASFSKAWQSGISNMTVFYVNSDQVTKEAMSGEYMSKGAFMVYGKKNNMNAQLKISVGVLEDGRVIAGPLAAIEKNCGFHINLTPGRTKKSEIAKKILKTLEYHKKVKLVLDEVMQALPSGDCEIEKEK